MGEEVFKVVLIDLGQILLTTALLDYLRAALIKCGGCTKVRSLSQCIARAAVVWAVEGVHIAGGGGVGEEELLLLFVC